MLEFKSVTKKYGSIKAVEDVSFSVAEGEFVFITGPTGSGKTTILKLLIKEILPSSGQISFKGKDLGKLKKRQTPDLRQEIGSIFQDFKLLSSKTVEENLKVALAVKNVDKTKWDARIKHVLELVGLADRATLFPSQLSGGEIQRAAIARALVINPKLIFADEPTGNLDWDTTESIINLLDKINKEGRTVIVTTHNKNVVQKLGHRVIEMKKGKIVSDSKKTKSKKSKKS